MRAHRASIPSFFALLFASVLLSFGASAAEPVKVVVLEPGSGEFETLLRREVASAGQLSKVPFLQITAEWCGPCKALRASLGDPLMRDAFAGTYIIQVDFDEWQQELESQKELADSEANAERLSAPDNRRIPVSRAPENP